MTLKETHKQAVEDKDFCQKKAEILIKEMKLNTSGAFWHIEDSEKYILEQAKKLDSFNKDEKNKMPFFGLSVGIKDLFTIKGMKTTAGSRILDSFYAPYDSTMWKSLYEKGSMFGGKLAMDEFAMGSFTNTSFYGKVSIPKFPNHSAGGSSGGSAAVVAANLVDFSIGSDTGGSVRQPASFCSVVGYKPSYGAFSRYGMISYASSLDQAGFFSKDLEDLKYILSQSISEKDDRDMTCVGLGSPSWESLPSDWTVGYFEDFLTDESIQSVVRVAYSKSLEKLKEQGAKLVPIKINLMSKAAQIYYIIACSEASSNLSRYQGVFFGKTLLDKKREGSYWEQVAQYRSELFGLEVQKRILLGSAILSSENYTAMYQKSVLLREELKKEINQKFELVDYFVLPVSPIVSPTWDEIHKMTTAQIYMADCMTVPFSLAGVPALSLPWYKDEKGLGIGIQVVGKRFSDFDLINRFSSIDSKIEIIK